MMPQDGQHVNAFEKAAVARQLLHQAEELLIGIYTDHISMVEDHWEEGAAKALGELAGELSQVQEKLDDWIMQHIESLIHN